MASSTIVALAAWQRRSKGNRLKPNSAKVRSIMADPLLDRGLPHNIDAEGVLEAILQDDSLYA